jgi:hypothetical protein
MTLTNKERESMDNYFKRKGLARLWENLKLFVENSKGSGGNTGTGGNTGGGNTGSGNGGNTGSVSGNLKTFKRKLPFVEMHLSESFLTDVLGYESVDQAIEWLPYRNKVSLGSARYPKENQSYTHRSSIPNTLALYKGSHQSKTTLVDLNAVLKSFDTSVYQKLDSADDSQYEINYSIMYFRNDDFYEREYHTPDLTIGEEIIKYEIVPRVLTAHYLPLSEVVERTKSGSAKFEIVCFACRLKKDEESFTESDDENIRNLYRLFDYYSFGDYDTKPRTVAGVCAKFEELLSKIDPSKVHSATYFNIFDETKVDDYISEPFNTHVFRFIPDNYPYHSTGGQVTRVELYPCAEDFRYVFGNTNVNSNAYLIDSSLLNEDRDIAITDTINDDLEEEFTEVYPCV